MKYFTRVAFFAAMCIFALSACAKVEIVGYRKNLASWNGLKWENIIPQKYDYSCGTASLATLVSGYFGDLVLESMMLEALVASLSREEVDDRIKNGFSLLDLKRAASLFGYEVTGVKLRPEAVFQLKGPIIVILRESKWEHFVVLKGVHGDRAFLADPARGNMRLPLTAFYAQWDGTALVLDKPSFNLPIDYPLALKADLPDVWPESDSLRQVSPAFHPSPVRGNGGF